MSTSALRDAFNVLSLPAGVRCTAARLSYCDAQGNADGARNHQRLTFDVVNSADNSGRTIESAPLPPGSNILFITQALAKAAIGAA